MKKHSWIVGLFCLSIAASGFAQGYDFLVREAEQLIRSQDYEKALEAYEKAWESGEYHYSDFINAARVSALLEDADRAFGYLNRSVEAGLLMTNRLTGTEELTILQADPRWAALLASIEERIAALEASFPEAHPEDWFLDLPEPRDSGDVSVEEAVKNRRSVRSYLDAPLTLQEVSQLLWAAYGITEPLPDGPAFLRGGKRAAPSAGARYPLELYLVAKNVDGLDPGVYWYKSEAHRLVRVSEEDRWDAVSEAAFHQPHFRSAVAAIVWSAVYERNMEKYGKRGRERYVCIDLGHSGENVYLQAYALKVGTCAIGAFTDILLKQAVDMTKEEEPLYIMPLGKVE